MKIILTLFAIFLTVFQSICAQDSQAILLLVNDHNTVNLFFPSKIQRILPGAPHFQITHDNGTDFCSITGTKGDDSNITVMTAAGSLYSFKLQFSNKVDKFNYILQPSQAIGSSARPVASAKPEPVYEDNTSADTTPLPLDTAPVQPETPVATSAPTVEAPSVHTDAPGEQNPQITATAPEERPEDTPDADVDNGEDPSDSDTNSQYDLADNGEAMPAIITGDNDLYYEDRDEYYRIFSENNFLQPSYIKRMFSERRGIILRLNTILQDRDELYFVLQLENTTNEDFDIGFLNFFYHKKGSREDDLMEPLFKFNFEPIVYAQATTELVYVFKKFKIDTKEKVVIVLDQKEGKKSVILTLYPKQLNNPRI